MEVECWYGPSEIFFLIFFTEHIPESMEDIGSVTTGDGRKNWNCKEVLAKQYPCDCDTANDIKGYEVVWVFFEVVGVDVPVRKSIG